MLYLFKIIYIYICKYIYCIVYDGYDIACNKIVCFGFLSSAIKIFEHEEENDENVIV